jgi:hypothetical protein
MGKVRPIVAKELRRRASLLVTGVQGIYSRYRELTGRGSKVGGRGRDAAHMARARAKRAPFTDPRDGRLFRQIRFAFTVSRGEPLSTTKLLQSCYPMEHLWGEIQSWHRASIARAARRVATPIARATTPGRPLIWKAIPELMELRSPISRSRRRREASRRG